MKNWQWKNTNEIPSRTIGIVEIKLTKYIPIKNKHWAAAIYL